MTVDTARPIDREIAEQLRHAQRPRRRRPQPADLLDGQVPVLEPWIRLAKPAADDMLRRGITAFDDQALAGDAKAARLRWLRNREGPAPERVLDSGRGLAADYHAVLSRPAERYAERQLAYLDRVR